MPVNLEPANGLLPVPGIKLATTAAGIKYADRCDLVLLFGVETTRCAGVFTQNSFAAAPVQICRMHLLAAKQIPIPEDAGQPRALLINSGNANAATGQAGFDDALASCSRVAKLLGLKKEQVLPFSTGVIGERLPMDRMFTAIDSACGKDSLSDAQWLDAAKAIMTTDTVPKGFSRQFVLDDQQITITGIAKGAGMLRPDMATMLAFVATDALISQPCLDQLLQSACEQSFNRITVDGDTSTNDSLVLISSCAANHALIDTVSQSSYKTFKQELDSLCLDLAQSLVRDAEGATRFVSILVSGGESRKECLRVAYTIAESPLVKTALFAGDPNWGRFCMAIGRAGIGDLDVAGVSLSLGDVCVARGGELVKSYSEADASRVMQQSEYCVSVDLGRGDFSEMIWTSDLSYDYVKINAEYRT